MPQASEYYNGKYFFKKEDVKLKKIKDGSFPFLCKIAADCKF